MFLQQADGTLINCKKILSIMPNVTSTINSEGKVLEVRQGKHPYNKMDMDFLNVGFTRSILLTHTISVEGMDPVYTDPVFLFDIGFNLISPRTHFQWTAGKTTAVWNSSSLGPRAYSAASALNDQCVMREPLTLIKNSPFIQRQMQILAEIIANQCAWTPEGTIPSVNEYLFTFRKELPHVAALRFALINEPESVGTYVTWDDCPKSWRSTMRVITKYETFDGQLFDNKADAMAHEYKQHGCTVLSTWLMAREIYLSKTEIEEVMGFINAMTLGPNPEFESLVREVAQSDDEMGG